MRRSPGYCGGLDLARLRADLARADVRFILLVPLAVVAEQWVRAWKWRQLLHPMKPAIQTLHLLGAIMAGYLIGLLVPLGAGALARSWLVARRHALTTSGVLATVALDRLTDGVVFALLVPVALVLVAFPDPAGDIRAGLAWAAAGSLAFIALLLLGLVAYRRDTLREDGYVLAVAERLPQRLRGALAGVGHHARRCGNEAHRRDAFLWAGLAFGVALAPGTYLFLIVFLGFVAVLGHWARIPGSFIVAAIFALGLFGVAEATALAMVLVVQGASLLSVAALGALALWRQGVALADLRMAQRAHEASG